MTSTTASPLSRRASPAAVPEGAARLVVETPIGPLLVAGAADAVTHICLPIIGLAGREPGPGRVPAALHAAARQLAEYFAGRRHRFDLPLRPAGTPFQLAVWQALDTIGYGETITYAELARRAGRTGAFRAVGQANGANPLPIVLPCHRVVAAGGRLGGYGGGPGLKRQLLALEGSPLAGAP